MNHYDAWCAKCHKIRKKVGTGRCVTCGEPFVWPEARHIEALEQLYKGLVCFKGIEGHCFHCIVKRALKKREAFSSSNIKALPKIRKNLR